MDAMEEERGDEGDGRSEQAASTMKFSFTASKPKFSASRPPVFPKGKVRSSSDEGEENKAVEFVTAFGEQGIVAKDPKGLRGARVIQKLENSWRPEKRMKHIMMDSDVLASTDERFEKVENAFGVANPSAQYGLTVAVQKLETSMHEVVSIAQTQNGKTVVTRETEELARATLSFAQVEDERLRQDLVSLPDEADMDAYDDMPIEDFGEAMLRGMGWEKGKPIGRNCSVAVLPVEYVRRSGRTGLGAEPAPKDVNSKRQIKPGESRLAAPDLVASVGSDGRVRNVVTVDEKLVERSRKGVIVGKIMSIVSGRHVGLRGEVLDSEKPDQVSVKLVKSEEKVVVSAKDLVDIGSLEEEKVLKQIGQLRIGNGEASRLDNTKDDHDNLDTDKADWKDEKKHSRKEDRREGRREKDSSRRDERFEHRRVDEERLSRSRRGSRRDERVDQQEHLKTSSRDGRRERKRDEYERASDNVEDEDEGRVRSSEDRRGFVRDRKREERRDEGRRDSRRDERREDERAHREQGRSRHERDEGGAERDNNDGHLSRYVHEKERSNLDGGHHERDATGTTTEGRYADVWLSSQIRVRIISKTFKGGRFYLKKGRIVDVVTPKECDILLDETGEILQHVKQDHLETALPKRGGRVMIVGGKQRGLLGKLIERDSDGEVGLVQMEESFEMITLNLDLLAEFVGDASERDA